MLAEFREILGILLLEHELAARADRQNGDIAGRNESGERVHVPARGGAGVVEEAVRHHRQPAALELGHNDLIPRLFQAVQHCRRNIIKCRPDDCFCSPRAHQILGGAVAQNGIDGVDQDRFARTGLAGKDIQALLKMHVGLLDDCNIFNLQTAQHVRSLLPLFLPDVMPKLGANGLCVPL